MKPITRICRKANYVVKYSPTPYINNERFANVLHVLLCRLYFLKIKILKSFHIFLIDHVTFDMLKMTAAVYWEQISSTFFSAKFQQG